MRSLGLNPGANGSRQGSVKIILEDYYSDYYVKNYSLMC